MFKSARIKLTAAYISIIILITLTFSLIVYINVNTFTKRALETQERKVGRRLRELEEFDKLPPGFQHSFSEETAAQIRTNTIYLLVSLNIFIIVTSGGVAYWFAGRTLRPIEEMIDKQKKFIADAAHELKTPLTAMKAYLEVNRREEDYSREKINEIIDSTIEDVDSLTLLTNHLLKQSKYQDFQLNKKEDVFELKTLIMKVIKKLRSKAKAKGIKVTVDVEEFNIKANKQSIEELFTILIDNAIKFNNKNGNIAIAATQDGKEGVITVEDTGVGIDKNDIEYIFERFYKVDTSRTKTNSDGFGLGLSIAKDIINNHKGTISVTSKKDIGTTFKIKLPLKS